jgi:hypothetical protein
MATGAMAAQQPIEIDDNLVNGRTYTFQFQNTNTVEWFTSASTIQLDIVQNAPDFLTSLQVTDGFSVAGISSFYYVQFTYEGDGSDVVSDVAQSIIGAVLAGSQDNIVFIAGFASGAAQLPNAISSAVSSVASTVGQTAGTVVSNTLGGVSSGLSGWLIPVILVAFIVLLFEVGGVSGLKRSVAGE